MKTGFLIIAAVLLIASSAMAQPNIPEMPVWFEYGNTPYHGEMTSLTNFDTARGAKSALCFWIPGSKSVTWYNRYPGDTASSFIWPIEFIEVEVGDFNGDGVVDYAANVGRDILLGRHNCEPPVDSSIKAELPYIVSARPFFVGDFNNDGIDDILYRATQQPSTNPYVANIILGSHDLHNRRYIPVSFDFLGDTKGCLVDCYTTHDGKFRVVLFQCSVNSAGLRANPRLNLYEAVFSSQGNEVGIELHELSSAAFATANESTYGFHDKSRTRHTIDCNGRVFSLDNDTFALCHENGGTCLSPHYNSAENRFEWVGSYIRVDSKDTSIVDYNIHIGDPRTDTVPLCRFRALNKVPAELGGDSVNMMDNCVHLGDLDGDGLPEYALHFSNYSSTTSFARFQILKTIKVTTGVSTDSSADPDRSTNILRRACIVDQKLQLELSATDADGAVAQLYDLSGRLLHTIDVGARAIQQSQVSVDLSQIHLIAGVYYVRLLVGDKVGWQHLVYAGRR